MKSHANNNNLFFNIADSLERNWEADKLTMEKQVANFADYPDPVWVYTF